MFLEGEVFPDIRDSSAKIAGTLSIIRQRAIYSILSLLTDKEFFLHGVLLPLCFILEIDFIFSPILFPRSSCHRKPRRITDGISHRPKQSVSFYYRLFTRQEQDTSPGVTRIGRVKRRNVTKRFVVGPDTQERPGATLPPGITWNYCG